MSQLMHLETLHMVKGQQESLRADEITETSQFCSWDVCLWRVYRKGGTSCHGDYLLWLWGLWLSGLPGFPWEVFFPPPSPCWWYLPPCRDVGRQNGMFSPTLREVTQGSEKPEGIAGLLVQLNCAHAGTPRPPSGLWRALGHGEYPRRHLNEVSKSSGESCAGTAFGVSTWGWRKARRGGRRRVWVLVRKSNSLKVNRSDPNLWQNEKVLGWGLLGDAIPQARSRWVLQGI